MTIPLISTSPSAATPRNLWQWLKGLPYDHLRDALLVMAGLLYLLGYAVWSMHAWQNNLGLLPLLDAQYLLAGFIVACILLVGAISTWAAWWVRERIPGTLTAERAGSGWRKALRLAWKITFTLSFAGIVIMSSDWAKQHFSATDSISFIFIFAMLSLGFFSPAFEGVPNRPLEKFYFRFFSYYVVVFIVFLSLLLLALFLSAFTRHWPQELAGPKPRCAYLDLDASKLSPHTLNLLLSTSPPADSSAGIVRSNPLNIFFVGETLLVKPANATQRTNETYEISKGAVAAITWCTP